MYISLYKREGERFEKWSNNGLGLNWSNQINNYKYHFHCSWSNFENDYLYNYRLFGNMSQTLPNGKVIRNEYDIQVEEKDTYQVEQYKVQFEQSFSPLSFYQFHIGLEAIKYDVKHVIPGSYTTYPSIHPDNEKKDVLSIEIPKSKRTWTKTIHMAHDLNFFKRVYLVLGLRSTQYELLKKLNYNPRLSLRIDIQKSLSFNAKWGQYYQYLHQMSVKAGDYNPSRTSYTWALANEQLKPEFAEHKTFGFTFDKIQYQFAISAYHKRLNNLLFPIPSVLLTTENQFSDAVRIDYGSKNSKGIELLLWKKYGLLSGWLLYQVGTTYCQFTQINQGKRFLADYNRIHEINWIGKITWKDWTCSLLWIFASGVPYSTAEHTMDGIPIEYDFVLYFNRYLIEENHLPHYHRMDVKIAYKRKVVQLNLECGVTVFNLFNRPNILDQYYNDMSDFFWNNKSDLRELGRTLFVFLNMEI